MDSSNDAVDNSGKMPFPFKLFQMLTDADEKGFRHIVSWNPNGKSFKVHDAAAFTKCIVPKYFKQTRYKSFQRQLCLYGFDRVLTGHNKGSRYHCKFVRGNYKLVNEIKYIGIKSKAFQHIQQQNQGTNKKAAEKMIVASHHPQGAYEESSSSSSSTASTDSSSFCSISRSMSVEAVCHSGQQPSTSLTNTIPQMKSRTVSPSMSPVASRSENDLHCINSEEEDPTPLSEIKGLDDLGLFEGMEFHLMEPISGCGGEVDREVEDMAMPNKAAFSTFPPPRQVSCGEKLSGFSSKEMYDAWQRGFEHALSMPPDSCWSFVSESEINV